MADKIAREVAEAEFQRFADMMDLDVDTSDMTEEDRQAFEQQRDRLLAAIQAGALVINEEGEPVFTPTRTADAAPITFREPTGASLMAMDKRKKTEDIAKLYAAMADMSGSHPSTFARMKMADLKIAMAITTLFLA